MLASFWLSYGKIWHGYEVVGSLKSLDKPVLFIFFHGAISVDIGIFLNYLTENYSKTVYSVSDKFLHKLSVYNASRCIQNCIEGSREECVRVLRQGDSLMIAPGGSFEAMFGDKNYNLLWRNRVGFAKVAHEAKVDIVPVFTRNIQEAFRPVPLFQKLLMNIYLKTRIPLMPMFGGFPVKLKTYVGKPIKIKDGQKPEDIRNEVERELRSMILTYQRVPGSIWKALLERF